MRVRFPRTHLLFDIGTATVISAKRLPWACSDTEAAQPTSGRGNRLHRHSGVSSIHRTAQVLAHVLQRYA